MRRAYPLPLLLIVLLTASDVAIAQGGGPLAAISAVAEGPLYKRIGDALSAARLGKH